MAIRKRGSVHGRHPSLVAEWIVEIAGAAILCGSLGNDHAVELWRYLAFGYSAIEALD